MVFSINPDNLENNDFRLVDDDGDFELLHKPSGATFTYDAGESAWIPSAGFGTDANPVSGTSHFEAVSADDLDTGRDWEDVTGSRSFDTTETNDTDSEIKAYVQIDVESDNATVGTNFEVDGGRVDRFFRDGTDLNDGDRVVLQAPAIPPGSTYEVVAFRDVSDYTINKWREFRP